MRRSKLYYSPRLRQELITPLYYAAKSEDIPMTALASRLVAEGLAARVYGEQTSFVAEAPPIEDPDGQVQ